MKFLNFAIYPSVCLILFLMITKPAKIVFISPSALCLPSSPAHSPPVLFRVMVCSWSMR